MRIKDAVKAGQFQLPRPRHLHAHQRPDAVARKSPFVKHGVPFQIVKGLAFFERKENQRRARLPAAARQPAGRRQLPPHRERAGPRHRQGLARQAPGLRGRQGNRPARGRRRRSAQITDIKGKAATGLRDFHRIMTELRTRLDLPPHELVRARAGESGLREDAPRIGRRGGRRAAGQRRANSSPRRSSSTTLNPESTITDFLEQITLASDVDGWDEQADHVSVMTLHASKGLEFPVVYILAVEEGLLPHERSLAQRRGRRRRTAALLRRHDAGDEGTVPVPRPAARVPRAVELRHPSRASCDELPREGVEYIDPVDGAATTPAPRPTSGGRRSAPRRTTGPTPARGRSCRRRSRRTPTRRSPTRPTPAWRSACWCSTRNTASAP